MVRCLLGFATLVCFTLSLVGTTQANILTFDDIYVLEGAAWGPVPNGYGSLNWENMGVTNGATVNGGNSGYNGGRVSGDYVAFNMFENPATVTVAHGTFDFKSTYLAAAFRSQLQVNVRGYLNGNLLYDQTVQLSDATGTPGAGAQRFHFNFLGIDKLVFDSFGGEPKLGSTKHFAMDNFDYTLHRTAIPEPGSSLVWCALMLAGLGMTNRRRDPNARSDSPQSP